MDARGSFSIARREIRCDVPTPEHLRELLAAPLPLGLRGVGVERHFFRDVYLDTTDARLREHGVTCRFRASDDDRRRLTVHIDDPLLPADSDVAAARRYDADVPELDAERAAGADNEPARRLRALVDPTQLRPTIIVTTERVLRRTIPRWLRRSQFDFVYDFARVEYGALWRAFQELRVWRLRNGSPTLARVAEALERGHEVHPSLVDPFERIRSVASSMAREAERRAIDSGRAVGVVVIADDRVACLLTDGALTLPIADGSGEGACRNVLATYFGSAVGDLRMVGTVPGRRRDSLLEVWTASQIRRGRDSGKLSAVVWLTPNDLVDRLSGAELTDAPTRSALALIADAGLLPIGSVVRPSPTRDAVDTGEFADDGQGGDSERHLDGERSILEFNARVLAMAEAPMTPLLERFRYLAIVSANLDEFFAVQVAALKRGSRRADDEVEVGAPRANGYAAAVRARVESLIARQQRCLEECRRELARHGVVILPWSELEVSERAVLRQHFRSVIMPGLTPQAMTEAPGFPAPHVSTLDLFFIVMVKDPATGPMHLACLRVPAWLPRFIPVRGGAALLPVEDLIRDQLDVVYRGRDVLEAYLFRVTRGAELDVDEAEAGNLLQAIEEDAKRRRGNAVVRVEVEPAMPASRRSALLAELRADRSSESLPLDGADVYEIEGLLDLTALRELAALPHPELRFPPFHGVEPFPATASIFTLIAERDRLVHH